MGDTAISWTDKTWNVIRGCRRVSEGCRNCYAERVARRFGGKGGPYEGLVETRLRVISDDEQYLEPRWTGKIVFDENRLTEPLRWGKPCMVFVNSMSDLFFEDLSHEQVAAIFGVMAACKRHTFQVLTKRSGRMREWFAWIAKEAITHSITPARRCFIALSNFVPWFREYAPRTRSYRGDFFERQCNAAPWPLPNVWMGVSTENQDAADERIADLLSIAAAIRFISAEPLLGAIDLEHVQRNGEFELNVLAGTHGVTRPHAGRGEKLDWVIAGAESGPRRRPCDYRWLRSLRNQCSRHGTAFFLKQAECKVEDEGPGAFGYGTNTPRFVIAGGEGSKKKQGGIFERPYLDGRQHLEFPTR
jgi:protein gp37